MLSISANGGLCDGLVSGLRKEDIEILLANAVSFLEAGREDLKHL